MDSKLLEHIQKNISMSDNSRLKEYYKEFSNEEQSSADIIGAWKFLQWILDNK